MNSTQQLYTKQGKINIFWFFLGSGAWFACIGIQTVLFPWLLTGVLSESARWVGVAQMCIMLPVVFFVLPAGHIADRVNLKNHLLVIQSLATLPALLLAFALTTKGFYYWQLIVYALAMGVLSAFANPTREAFLNKLGKSNIEQAVTINIGIEFGIQVVGFFLGGLAVTFSPQYVLALQAMLMIVGALAVCRIKINTPIVTSHHKGSMTQEIRAAIKVVINSPVLSQVIFLNLIIGVAFLGSFFVLIPIVVTKIFSGGAKDLALANIMFMMGTILSVVVLILAGGIHNRGRALLISCAFGAVLLMSLAMRPNWMTFIIILFVWGAAGGVTLSMGQTLIQENVPEQHKGRILSIFLLCFMGGNPIGSFLMGNLLEFIPTMSGGVFPGILMLMCVAYLLIQGQLWSGSFSRENSSLASKRV